jgi:hypothetical protein
MEKKFGQNFANVPPGKLTMSLHNFYFKNPKELRFNKKTPKYFFKNPHWYLSKNPKNLKLWVINVQRVLPNNYGI